MGRGVLCKNPNERDGRAKDAEEEPGVKKGRGRVHRGKKEGVVRRRAEWFQVGNLGWCVCVYVCVGVQPPLGTRRIPQCAVFIRFNFISPAVASSVAR